ncbi:hypothetical protein AURDEDRAFT_167487 [Auricularia subglabra TFB-10046 SS5]|nr:hypothetical protein AURDEDRAFT_167487 [Auricularia subglabra TFB-10046 SS5]
MPSALLPPFDFLSFLTTLHSANYQIEYLDGGRVNHTVRVTPLHDANDNPLRGPAFAHPWLTRSFIAKHAPPTLHYPGPEIPFSQVRLGIEARALALLSSSCDASPVELQLLPNSAQHQLGAHPQIVVPELLHYSPEAHVLLQTDLGALVPLTDWLFQSRSPISLHCPSPTASSVAGAALGAFLGALHALPASPGLRAHFANPDADKVLFDATVRPLCRTLAVCGVRDAEALGDALEHEWRQFDEDKNAGRLPANRLAFGHGDMWHTNVFIVPGDGIPKVAVIDWEFAAVGRVGLDIARITAYLFLFSQSTRMRNEARENLQDFTQGLLRGFAREFPQIARGPANESFCMLYGLHLCNGASWLRCSCTPAQSGFGMA